jgi:hypothetical protein
MRGRLLLAALAGLLVAGPATAIVCVYIDKDGNKFYSNTAPEKGWTKLDCADGDEPAPAKRAKPDMREWSRWYDARIKIKLGMNEAEVRAPIPCSAMSITGGRTSRPDPRTNGCSIGISRSVCTTAWSI